MKKKLALLIAAICSLVAMATFSACYGEATISYQLSADGTYYIVSGVTGSQKGLTEANIPATYGEQNEAGEVVSPLPVKAIAANAFSGCTRLKSVTLPEGITTIGECAFKGTAITTVVVPSGVTVIEDETFRECTSLYNVTLPEGILSIGVRAFMQCPFRTFTLPETVQTIGYGAFGMCRSLTEITIPASVTQMDTLAFGYCSSLSKVVIKAQMEELQAYVFSGSYAVVSSTQYIDSALTELYIPKSITAIHAYATYAAVLDSLHVYYEGTEEEWNTIKFFTRTAKKDSDGNPVTDTDGTPLYDETTYTPTEVLGSNITFNVNF